MRPLPSFQSFGLVVNSQPNLGLSDFFATHGAPESLVWMSMLLVLADCAHMSAQRHGAGAGGTASSGLVRWVAEYPWPGVRAAPVRTPCDRRGGPGCCWAGPLFSSYGPSPFAIKACNLSVCMGA